MNNIAEHLNDIIDNVGYILDHNLDEDLHNHVHTLIEHGILIGCDKIESTKNFMNSSYYFTWSDNRFNLYIHTENNLSWIAKLDR